MLASLAGAALWLTVLGSTLAAQEPGQAEKEQGGAELNYYPVLSRLPFPQLVSRAKANEKFGLYPLDWLSDTVRPRRLDSLAAWFAPVLHSSNFSVPRDVEQMLALDETVDTIACGKSARLVSDVWRLDRPAPERVKGEYRAYEIGSLAHDLCPNAESPDPVLHAPGFDALRNALRRYSPFAASGRAASAALAGRSQQDTVLFWDLPRDGPRGWRDYHKLLARQPKVVPKTYVHPFIYAHSVRRGEKDLVVGYEFVLQYWFFYPFNDGVNDHEGDWEHINVSVSTRSDLRSPRYGRLLDADQIHGIVGDSADMPLDSLVISAVDYYFHHYVLTLDYKPLYDPGFARETALYDWEFQERFGARLITRVRDRQVCAIDSTVEIPRLEPAWDQSDSGKKLRATHPVIFLGGINKSVLQLIEGTSQKNQNTDGSFPFPGLWLEVGTMATEQVRGKVKQGHRIKEADGDGPRTIAFTGGDIKILPDWEELYKKALDSASEGRYLREWAWLLLPARWGWPVTRSVGSGIIRDYDFGNVAPIGPAHNPGWSRVGTGPGYHRYNPYRDDRFTRRITTDFITPETRGFTIPVLLLTLVPPVSPIGSLVASVVKNVSGNDHTFFESTRPPLRVFDVAAGRSVVGLGRGLRIPLSAAQASGAGAVLGYGTAQSSEEPGEWRTWHVSFVTHLSDRVATEGLLLFSSATLRDGLRDPEGNFIGSLTRNAKAGEVFGAFRWTPAVNLDPISPFARVGYGWSWYGISPQGHVLDVTDNGVGPTRVNRRFEERFPLAFLPNSLMVGGGFDLNISPTSGEFGLRGALTMYLTKRLPSRSELTVQVYTGIQPTPER